MIRTSAFCRTLAARPAEQNRVRLRLSPDREPLRPGLTSLPGGPPAGDPGLPARGEVVGGGGQTDGPDVLVQGHVGVQLHDGDVVVVGYGVVVAVGDDPPHAPPHRPLAGLTLLMQTQQHLPLVGLGVPAHTGQRSL